MSRQLTDCLLHGGTVSSLQLSTLKISGEELANMCFTDLFTNSDNLMNTNAVPSGLSQKSLQGQIDDLVYAFLKQQQHKRSCLYQYHLVHLRWSLAQGFSQ